MKDPKIEIKIMKILDKNKEGSFDSLVSLIKCLDIVVMQNYPDGFSMLKVLDSYVSMLTRLIVDLREKYKNIQEGKRE